MSIQNAGAIIREARLNAGLSQEKFSEGVCSTLSLSRIENGTAGVSPATFQALMAHAGISCEAFPVFANRIDFDCFYTLKRTRFFLNSWQLHSAYDELEKIEEMHWAENKFYYQEWLLLHCKLQFRSGCGNHQQIYDMLLSAIRISRPEFEAGAIHKLLLSMNEIELFIALAQESLYLNHLDLCLNISTQISSYLTNSQISHFTKNQLLAENAIVYIKYLLAVKDYKNALNIADSFRHQVVIDMNDSSLHELSFLTALSCYYNSELERANFLFKSVFYSAHSTKSCYATTCRNYIQNLSDTAVIEFINEIPDIPLINFPTKKVTDTSRLGDGTYDLFSSDTLFLGKLIQELRIEQKISQSLLCQGLCSKSKLSKIENGTLQPEIALSEALLQRLGISDAVFTFYGNKHESMLFDLREKAIRTKLNDNTAYSSCLKAMQELLTPKDVLYKQYLLFKTAVYNASNEEKIQQLHNALSLTLPDFNIDLIHNYCLSRMELTILNNLSYAYANSSSPSVGIRYLYKIIEYLNARKIDILFFKRIFCITITMIFFHLYNQKRYSEILELRQLLTSAGILSDTYALGYVYAHFCQALGECKKLSVVKLYTDYACGNLCIHEDFKNVNTLCQYIKDDFKILSDF